MWAAPSVDRDDAIDREDMTQRVARSPAMRLAASGFGSEAPQRALSAIADRREIDTRLAD